MGLENNTEEIKSYLQKSEHDLYVELVPSHLREEMYDEQGLELRGKKIFKQTLGKVRSSICPSYKAQQERITNSAELVALLADLLVGIVSNVPVLTIATLIVKIGIDEICAETKE